MAGGRPTKYKAQYCDDLVAYMSKGMPYETFAAEIGVARETLYDWEKKYPEFAHAKKRAREQQYKTLASTGMLGMVGKITMVTSRETRTITRNIGGEELKEVIVKETIAPCFNSTAWIFYMKNCCGWRDVVEFTDDEQVDSMEFE